MSRELLQQALDALETKYSDYLYDGAGPAIAGAFEADIAALRAALAQPAPEPIAWAMLRADGLVLDVICPDEHNDVYEGAYTVPLYAAPQPAPAVPESAMGNPISPMKPLTDEQIDKIFDGAHENMPKGVLFRTFVARAIEQAHGIGDSND